MIKEHEECRAPGMMQMCNAQLYYVSNASIIRNSKTLRKGAPHNFIASLHQCKLTRGIKRLVRPGELLLHICRTLKKCPRIPRCDNTAPISLEDKFFVIFIKFE